MKKMTIYTDGSCLKNPGPGGFASILKLEDGSESVIKGGEPETTNNRMELMAPITALESLSEPSDLEIYSDSQYVIKGITLWIKGWIAKDWHKVKNIDLWKRLLAATSSHKIKWTWVRGHAGNRDNERVDLLANNEAKMQKKLLGK